MSIRVGVDNPSQHCFFEMSIWTEVAVVVTALASGIILVAGGLTAYYFAHQVILGACFAGGGVVMDTAVIAATLLYHVIISTKKDKATSLAEHGRTTSSSSSSSSEDLLLSSDEIEISGYTWEPIIDEAGCRHARDVYRVSEDGEAKYFVKIESEKSRKKRKKEYAKFDRAAYQLSENLFGELGGVVPETRFYTSGQAAKEDLFEGNEALSFLDEKLEITVVQDAVQADPMRNPQKEWRDVEKQAGIKDFELDVTFAHKTIIYEFIVGRFDCGVVRVENTVVDIHGRPWAVDNDRLGREITDNIHCKSKNKITSKMECRQHHHVSWLLSNDSVKDELFSEELVEHVLNVDEGILMRNINRDIPKDRQRNIRSNLQKVQKILRTEDDITPTTMFNALDQWSSERK